MIIAGGMPAQHFSGVSHHRRRSRHADHDFAGAVGSYLGRIRRSGYTIQPTT
jgi:hypothetical protein